MEGEQSSPALRVSQLDSLELDEAAFEISKSQLGKVFKYLQTGCLSTFEPETEVVLKYIIWHLSIGRLGASLGQQMLGLHYSQKSTGRLIGSRERRLHAVLLILLPWLQHRASSILRTAGLQDLSDWVDRGLGWLELALKLAALANFLAFLHGGGHASLAERLLGLQSAFPRRQALRQVSFEFMTREMLWHGFSEFLYFVIPILNIPRIRNRFHNWFRHHQADIGAEAGDEAPRLCTVCGDSPTQPHQIGCQHVFCFYCLQSNWTADPAFSCPSCSQKIVDSSHIRPLKRRLHPKSA